KERLDQPWQDRVYAERIQPMYALRYRAHMISDTRSIHPAKAADDCPRARVMFMQIEHGGSPHKLTFLDKDR
ncbi:MAG: hypothetical protein QM639_13760, partial [Rhodocyclaceae bacterium]